MELKKEKTKGNKYIEEWIKKLKDKIYSNEEIWLEKGGKSNERETEG